MGNRQHATGNSQPGGSPVSAHRSARHLFEVRCARSRTVWTLSAGSERRSGKGGAMSTKLRVLRVAAVALLFVLSVCGAATLKGQLVRNRIGGAPVTGAAVA